MWYRESLPVSILIPPWIMIHEVSDVHMLYEMDSAHAVLGIPLSWCVCAALFVWYIHMVLYHVVCYPAVLLLLHDHGCGYRDPSSHDHHGVCHPPTIHLTGCGVCPSASLTRWDHRARCPSPGVLRICSTAPLCMRCSAVAYTVIADTCIVWIHEMS